MELTIRTKIVILLMALVLISSTIVGFYIVKISQRSLLNPDEIDISDKLKGEAFAVIVATFLITAIISYFFSKSITAPIEKLIIGTQLVAKGQLDYRIKKRSHDEVGRLVDNFNRMIDNLSIEREMKSEYSSLAKVEKSKAELIIDSMADGVIVTDKEFKVTIFNPSVEEIFNLDRKKIIKKNILHLLKKFKIEDIFYEIPENSSEISRFKIVSKEYTIQVDGNKKVIKITIAPIRVEKRKISGAILVIEDITNRKEIENLKSEFVSVVSHELRTPLTCISGYGLLLNDEKLGSLTEKQKKALKVINKETNRLTGLVNDLLDLSKLESGRMKLNKELTDIRDCLKDCSALNIAKEKGIKVDIQSPELPKINVDKMKIIQVFTNLISNAAKFTKENGSITVKITNQKDFIKVEVKDTGIGIAKKYLSKLFDRFYQVDNALTRTQGGTGLGLTIVKEIITFHGGLLKVESVPRKGTSISFTLPKFTVKENILKMDVKRGLKAKCPAFIEKGSNCWTHLGVMVNKKPVFDKIKLCADCDVYKNIKQK